MRVGTPREIKNQEYRFGLTKESVRELTANCHAGLCEPRAGSGHGGGASEYNASVLKTYDAAAH